VCFCSVRTLAYNRGRREFLLYRTLHAIQHSSSSPIITFTHLQHPQSSSPSPPSIHHPSPVSLHNPSSSPFTRVKGGGGGCCVFLLGSNLRLIIISSTHHHLLSTPSPIFNIPNHHHRHLLASIIHPCFAPQSNLVPVHTRVKGGVCFFSVRTLAYGRRDFLLYRTLHAIQHSSSSPIITFTHLQHPQSSSPGTSSILCFAPQPILVPVHTRSYLASLELQTGY
jgi:hypothetical protein